MTTPIITPEVLASLDVVSKARAWAKENRSAPWESPQFYDCGIPRTVYWAHLEKCADAMLQLFPSGMPSVLDRIAKLEAELAATLDALKAAQPDFDGLRRLYGDPVPVKRKRWDYEFSNGLLWVIQEKSGQEKSGGEDYAMVKGGTALWTYGEVFSAVEAAIAQQNGEKT